jgi:hypothetical protein
MNFIKKNDILSKCQIIEQNDEHYYLDNMEGSFYDIILVKGKKNKNKFRIGDVIKVKVLKICVANDGTPGLFVEYIE